MASRYKHHKAFICRIENTGRIKRIEGNWHVHINTTDSLQITIDNILEKHNGKNIVIKSEKGGIVIRYFLNNYLLLGKERRLDAV